MFDLRLNSHSRLNLIQALIQAINAGADEALMLDPRGFVASCNSTNFFIVRGGELWTSTGLYSFKGITQQQGGRRLARRRRRGARMRLHAGPGLFRRRSLCHRHAWRRDAGDAHRRRVIGNGKPGPVTARAGELYLRAALAS